MRIDPGRLRRDARVRPVRGRAVLRRQWAEQVRGDAVHAEDLCAARRCVRIGVGRLQHHHLVWNLPERAGLRGKRRAEPVQLRADYLPGARGAMRNDPGRLRDAAAVWHLPGWRNVRRRRRQQVRHHSVHANHLRGPGRRVRHRVRWMQRHADLPVVSRGPDLQCAAQVRVRAQDLCGLSWPVRRAQRWVHWISELRLPGSCGVHGGNVLHEDHVCSGRRGMRQRIGRVRLDAGLRNVHGQHGVQCGDAQVPVLAHDVLGPGVGLRQRPERMRQHARLRRVLGRRRVQRRHAPMPGSELQRQGVR